MDTTRGAGRPGGLPRLLRRREREVVDLLEEVCRDGRELRQAGDVELVLREHMRAVLRPLHSAAGTLSQYTNGACGSWKRQRVESGARAGCSRQVTRKLRGMCVDDAAAPGRQTCAAGVARSEQPRDLGVHGACRASAGVLALSPPPAPMCEGASLEIVARPPPRRMHLHERG